MTSSIPDILARIVACKREELPRLELRRQQWEVRAETANASRRDFTAALRRTGPSIIAEIKKASPSKGLLCADFQPPRIASAYEAGGAAALSVLTDADFFQGSLADLEAARAAVALPVLRKDFTIDPLHIVQAARHGADAILLIAAILSTRQLRDFREMAAQYKMAALVEVHDAAELQSAIDSGAVIIGVNNRNLHTFELNLQLSLDLSERIPGSCVRVAESGIHSAVDVHRLRAAGYDAFLVGERFMTAPDPAAAVRELRA